MARKRSRKAQKAVAPQFVEAVGFRLVDRAGRPRAVLDMTRNGPRLAMFHEDGTVGCELTLSQDGPGLRLNDGDGRTRLFAGATRGAARLGMADGLGAQRLFLGVSASGTPAAVLYNGDQQRLWAAGSGVAKRRLKK